MRDPNPTKLFISYAHADGADLAQHLVRDLAAGGLEPWIDTHRLKGGAIWTKEIEEALDSAEVVLALLTPGSYASEICRAEQLRALRKGKCVIPLLALTGADVPLHLEPKQYLSFTGVTGYEQQFETLLESIGKREGASLKPAYRYTYVTAPPPPGNFVDRPAELAALRNALIADGSGRHVALTALHGMGGIGKTILAQALCADEVTQQAFPDGIIWVSIGKESTESLVTRMREVAKGLKDDLSLYDTTQGSIHQYRTTLRGKAALIVLDDVWDARDVEPFRADSPRSRLLFTTRHSSIAATAGATEFTANLPTEEQSRAFLAKWSGRSPSEFPPQADDLIRECGRLPLALSMVGATLRGKPVAYWKGVLDLLRHADLKRIRAQFPDYPHSDLFRAIDVSVSELDPQLRERYIALAVLLEDMPAEIPVLRTLWNVDEFGALETAEDLVSRSLATHAGNAGAIDLHDLQLDYIRAQSPLREALPLIHDALRISANVVSRDPHQFASQLVGRLLSYEGDLSLRNFVSLLSRAAPRPWVRPRYPGLSAPGGALTGTLKGHSSSVNAVALNADGRRAVSASWDYKLKVWDTHSSRELHTLAGHSDWVYGVALSADGRRTVSASKDHTLKVWDTHSGRELRTLAGHSDWVYGVALSADGLCAVSASSDKTLKVWDTHSGRELRTLEGHSDSVVGVALSANGHRAVSASRDKTLKVWDTHSGRELRSLEGHSDSVVGVALSANGRRAVSASWDKTLKVWDLDSGREVTTLTGHFSSVNGVALSADGRRAVSVSHDKTVKVWDVDLGSEIATFTGHANIVNGVALSEDGRRAVSASSDHTLKVWDTDSGRELRTPAGHSQSVHGVALSEDGRRAVSASYDKTLKLWDTDSGKELRTLAGHSDGVTGVALHADGRRAVSASRDNTLKVWDIDSGRELRTLAGHSHWVNAVALSADGRRAVSASYDKTLKVWDLDSGREVTILAGHFSSVNGVALSADGQRAVSASHDKTLKVWDTDSGRELRTLEGHSSSVLEVTLSADGHRAVSVSLDNTLKVWDVDMGDVLATFTCDAPAVCCAWRGSGLIIVGDDFGRMHFLTLVL